MLAISFGLKCEGKAAWNNFSSRQRDAGGSNCYHLLKKGWRMGSEFNKTTVPLFTEKPGICRGSGQECMPC